ncbi:MAG: ankyrin repeat domain-containing protein [Fimbriimonadaceae bacterium]|nr:ankyrin repeat domain-containing protein [Fimbriimonadaceae bacterium]
MSSVATKGLILVALVAVGCGSAKGPATFEDLTEMAHAGRYDEVAAALRRDGTTDRRGQSGITLLHDACFEGDVKLVRVLLDVDAAIGLVDSNGYSALHWAATSKDLPASGEIVKTLLARGAEVDRHSNDQSTPLFLACRSSYGAGAPAVKRVQLLLEAGADPNARCFDGQTPLHMAASRANDRVIEALLEAGAKPMALDSEGRTPLQTLLWWQGQLPPEAKPIPPSFAASRTLLMGAASSR